MNFRQGFLVREKKSPGFGPHQIFCGRFVPRLMVDIVARPIQRWFSRRCKVNHRPTGSKGVNFLHPGCQVYQEYEAFLVGNFNLKLYFFPLLLGGGTDRSKPCGPFQSDHLMTLFVVFSVQCRPVNYLRWGLSSCPL